MPETEISSMHNWRITFNEGVSISLTVISNPTSLTYEFQKRKFKAFVQPQCSHCAKYMLSLFTQHVSWCSLKIMSFLCVSGNTWTFTINAFITKTDRIGICVQCWWKVGKGIDKGVRYRYVLGAGRVNKWLLITVTSHQHHVASQISGKSTVFSFCVNVNNINMNTCYNTFWPTLFEHFNALNTLILRCYMSSNVFQCCYNMFKRVFTRHTSNLISC